MVSVDTYAPAMQSMVSPEISPTGKAPVVLVSLPAALDLEGCMPLKQRVSGFSRTCSCLVVDLDQSPFADSSGVRALLDVAEAMEARGGELRLIVRPGSRIERTFRLLWLMDELQVYPSVADALAQTARIRA